MTWVVFDYGGVVCHHQPEQDIKRLVDVAGCSPADFNAAYWSHRLEFDRADLDATGYWRRVGEMVGREFSPDQIAELSRIDIASWLHLQSETVGMIEAAAAAGHRLALLSNAPADVAQAVARLPVAENFRHLLFSCFLRAAKPQASCYQAALRQIGAAPGDTIFIDDREENVRAANQVGMRGVRFISAGQTRAALAECGVAAG